MGTDTVVGHKTMKRKGLYILEKCAWTMSCACPTLKQVATNDNRSHPDHTTTTTTAVSHDDDNEEVAMSQPTTTTTTAIDDGRRFFWCVFFYYSYFTLLKNITTRPTPPDYATSHNVEDNHNGLPRHGPQQQQQ